MPAVHSIIPQRQSRRLRQTGPKDHQDDDDLWETYDATLLTSVPLLNVKSEPAPVVLLFDVAHIPRSPNAFIFFRSAYVKAQKEAAARSGSLNQTDLSRDAGIVWKKMHDDENFPYRLMARDAKTAHALKYPNYRYAPKSANGVARKNQKPKATTIRRAASATSDDSDVPPRSRVSHSRPSRKYETNPPTARSAARRTSTPVTPPPRRVSPSPTPAPAPVAPTLEASPVVPKFAPEAYTDNDDKLETAGGSLLASRPILPFGVKRSLSPTIFESLTLPIPSSPSTQALPLDDFVAARPSRASSPVVPVPPAAAEWDGWVYTPLEFPEDEPLCFDAPAGDFGFYHPWNLDVPSGSPTPVIPADDFFMF
ncbi:hypothetical protein C8F04DRAFT_1107467 [Mycena alexandri]|uniref:HMG box domain-containing protein n=1 Tax=Mycena alexandri TaxID=1745969 RepID=A0AAD6SRL9_9AGAR|nr:hypothetical protein C8F04DRAFT_1107467 [Mycena alexandri]